MNKKQTIILLASIIIMFIFCLYYAIASKTVAIAGVAARFHENGTLIAADFTEVDSVFSKSIFVELGLFSLIQIIGFAMYLQKNKKVLSILLLIEVILTIIEIFCYSSPEYIIFALPIINIGLYLYGLKYEVEEKEEKKPKTKTKTKKEVK